MVLDIFDDESENSTEIKKCRNPNDGLKIKFKYKVRWNSVLGSSWHYWLLISSGLKNSKQRIQ